MQTVGELLRGERESKGLSLKDIETAISIRTLYINAIEEGNYNLVPGEVYLKGFIRNYANFLGLNGQEMVNSYRQSQELPPLPVNANVTPKSAEPLPEKPPKTTNKSNKWLIISLMTVCVVGATWWLLDSPQPAKEPQANKQIQTPAIPVQPVPTQSITPTTPAQTKPVVITGKYTEQCWTSVVADGKQIYEGIPQNGESITWEAQKSITITVGNAGGIDIISNGQSMGKLGTKGEVVVKTFAPKQ